MTSGESIRKSEISRFDARSFLTAPCRMVNTPAITAGEPGSSSWILNYAKSPSILTEFYGEMYSLQAEYVSFQFREVKHPKLPKAFGSTILFSVHSQNASIVIRTICALTGRMEDREVWYESLMSHFMQVYWAPYKKRKRINSTPMWSLHTFNCLKVTFSHLLSIFGG